MNKKGTQSKKSKPTSNTLPRGRHVVGIHSANEVIKVRPQAVDSLWLKQGWESNKDLKQLHDWATTNGKKVEVRPQGFFNQICNTHQGLCLVVTEKPRFDYQSLKQTEKKIVLILDGIEDPHNLGAVLRTAWLMGVSCVYIPKQKASPLTATAIKVASGAAEHVPVLEESNLGSVIKDLQQDGFWVYALAQNNKTTLYNVQLPEKVCWVIGSEGKGIRKPIINACDEVVSIPQIDSAASYNASVACAMALCETSRQLNSNS